MYKINDMTGEDIIVRKWLDNEVKFEVTSPLHVFIECAFTCTWRIPSLQNVFIVNIMFPLFLAD